MQTTVNEQALKLKLARIGQARDWSPEVLSGLESYIRYQEDFALFRINPLRYAKAWQISEPESIDLFLYGAHEGLFQMNWQLFCPSCGGVIESFSTLRNLHTHYNCIMCKLEKEAYLDDFISINFTISPVVRNIIFHHPERLTVEDYYYKYHFIADGMVPGGPRFVEVLPEMIKILSYLPRGQEKEFEIEASPGYFFFGHDLFTNAGFAFLIDGPPSSNVQNTELIFQNGQFQFEEKVLAPGRVHFSFQNKGAEKCSVAVFQMPVENLRNRMYLEFEPFLNGKKLLTNQTFLDLFQYETIQETTGIGARDLSFLFTDLKGSTALYDRIGDLKAFSLVRSHFGHLAKVIRKNNGAIVKTIGDAIMASFTTGYDALGAAIAMHQEIDAFNRAQGKDLLALKIGIHKGACIAVTMNARIDYFGQTVNIAARVQALANAKEIYISEDVYEANNVTSLLQGRTVTPQKARLKGVQEEMKVYKIL